MVHTAQITARTRGEGDMLDVGVALEHHLRESGIVRGILLVHVIGSTAAMTTVEAEPGLEQDLQTCLERLAPRDAPYAHEERWGDDNGHSHVRAAIVGPSVAIPVVSGRLVLGQWQQVVLLEFDTQARDRVMIVQIVGERD